MSTGTPTAARPVSIHGLTNEGHVMSGSILPLQETMAQKPIRLIRGLGEEPIAAARLATSLDFRKKSVEPPAVKGADDVWFSIEPSSPSFGFHKARRGQCRQIEFLRVRHLKEDDIKSGPAEKIDGFP